jgi:hypothetical protein
MQLKYKTCVYIYVYLGFFAKIPNKLSHLQMANCIFYVGKGSLLNDRANQHKDDDLEYMKKKFTNKKTGLQRYAVLTPFVDLHESEALLIEHKILKYLVDESKMKHVNDSSRHDDCRCNFKNDCLINKNRGQARHSLPERNIYVHRSGYDLFGEVVEYSYSHLTCKLINDV